MATTISSPNQFHDVSNNQITHNHVGIQSKNSITPLNEKSDDNNKNCNNQEKIKKYNSFKQRKEQEDFNIRLIEFHRHKNINTPITTWPTFNGKSINLFKLYNKVVDMGGWEHVCEKEKWKDVCSHLDRFILGSCTNGSHAIKLIYLRYLSAYEKVHISS